MVGATNKLLALLLFFYGSLCNAVSFDAKIDRDSLYQNEFLELKITLSNSDTRLRAEGINPNVDLSLLTKDFELGTPRATNRFNISRPHGRSTSSITITLFPKHHGQLTIPRFEVDGLTTQPISLNVLKPTKDETPRFIVKTYIDNPSPLTQQQTLIHIDLFHRVPIKSASLGGNLEANPLSINLVKLPQKTRKETVKGINYNVETLSWSITPWETGSYTIQLPALWIIASDKTKHRLTPNQLTFTAHNDPELDTNTLIGKPTITQQFPKGPFTENSLYTWAVTLESSQRQFPLQLFTSDFPPSFTLYKNSVQIEQTTDHKGISYRAKYSLSWIAAQGGTYQLPAITVPYYSLRDKLLTSTHIAAKRINVTPISPQPTIPPSKESIINPNFLPWQIATFLFASLSFIATIAWLKTRHHSSSSQTKVTIQNTPHPYQQELLAAFKTKTLAEGLAYWQENHPEDTQVAKVVLQVQQLYYGKKPLNDTSATSLKTEVNQAIQLIQTHQPMIEPSHDRWSPKTFSQIDPT